MPKITTFLTYDDQAGHGSDAQDEEDQYRGFEKGIRRAMKAPANPRVQRTRKEV